MQTPTLTPPAKRGRGMTPGYEQTCANILEFPSSHPDYVPVELPVRCKPGVFACSLYPGREVSEGGVFLPSNGGGLAPGSEGAAAERVRPDCAVVLSVGAQKPLEDVEEGEDLADLPDGWNTGHRKRHSARLLANALIPGDRVMLRPWSGVRHSNAYDVQALTFIGTTDPWEEDAVLRLDRGVWRPLNNWVVVRLDPLWKGAEGSDLVCPTNTLDFKGTILDMGPLAFLKTIQKEDGSYETIQTLNPGSRIVVADDMRQQSPDDIKWLTTKWGEWGDDVWLIREVDCDNVRRVVALLED